ncbi:cysteine desulfurase [Chlorobium ferrooxidans]|uniref:cysteine desulfurase n=1 Tax=Chlorobium ferrooxidans DSM 13031 TaxID=377431 RepID=Q0YUW8_9CHLB|nr:cysteine desulfurase [Chlorobium ferrooxidans]EAT59920.1 cysteine desulfurases, SufS subfamily [Chlorobium ferrooxidans DSM 13031]
MPREYEQPYIPGIESEAINPTLIAEIASRLFNDLPEAGSVPKYETDVATAPASLAESLSNKSGVASDEGAVHLPDNSQLKELPAYPEIPYFQGDALPSPEHDLYFLSPAPAKKEEPLGHHANKLTDQQNYSENSNGSYGLDQFIRRTLPPKPESADGFAEASPESIAPFFTTLNSGLPGEDDFSFNLLLAAAQDPESAASSRPEINQQAVTPEAFSGHLPQQQFPGVPETAGDPAEGQCYAEKLYRNFEFEQGTPDLSSVFQSLRRANGVTSPALPGIPEAGIPANLKPESASRPELPGKAPAPIVPNNTAALPGTTNLPFSIPDTSLVDPYYFLREPKQPLHTPEGFDVATIRKDFPVLHQNIHGKPLVWFDNAATTQKPLSVINAVAQFYATDNSNIHRGAHTLAARATDAYEGAREKIRQFIGAASTSEIIYVRGTTEGINLVAQTWGRKFLQPGDEIVLSILEHHANIVPWQMVAHERGARIKVVPVNDRGEIIMEEYTKLLGPRTKFVSLTQASNGLGTILPVREMIQLAKRFDAKVLIDGAQSVAHIPVNVQDLDADFFVFSGHKIFAPTGIGVVYGKRELLELMPPWQGGGNMIQDVRFEETVYNEPPAKFEAGTPSIGDAVGLGAALDYVRKIGLDNIARYEHELTEYGTERLIGIPGLRLIGTAQNKVGVLSFVLNNLPNEEVGKLLDQEGIAVRTGHHCTQPSLRRFGVEGTIRPSLAFYNTREEIDRLAEVINHIQRR